MMGKVWQLFCENVKNLTTWWFWRRILAWFNAFIREIVMEPVKPKISVEYAKDATIITFTSEKILEDKDIE